jgi:serine protease Do/serine protease DegQ
MGIVSALGRTNLGILGNEGYENFIQTDAAINRGNSGGAMIDTKGRLVGINTAIASQTGGNIGIGFAIPITMARRVVLDLLEDGEVRRGYLGVSIRDLDRDFAEAFSLESTDGALVEVVQEGGPAARSGIQRGDVIVQVEGRPIRNVSNLRLTVAGIRPNQEIEVVVMREGERVALPVKLGSLDDPTASLDERSSPLDGVEMSALDDELRAEWNIEESSGVLVTSVDVSSPFANALSAGMVILEVNDKEISTVSEFRDALVSGRVNRLWLSLRGNRGYVAIRVP